MSDSLNKNSVELLRALENLENDDDFITLKQKYETPNEFTIMGDKRREDWHSSFICWLLDPKQNHKMGTVPLKKFVELANKKGAVISPETSIDEMEFTLEKGVSNKKRIDIFGECDQLKLVIENKIKADENVTGGSAQTDDYYEYCEKNYSNSQRCYILLKADSSTKVSNEHFIHITYQELYDDVIKPLFELCQKKEIGNEDTKRVLEHYILDISNPFSMMLASTQEELSGRIYEKHKTIIEAIREAVSKYGIDDKSELCKYFKQNRLYINNIILKSLDKPIIEHYEEPSPQQLLYRNYWMAFNNFCEPRDKKYNFKIPEKGNNWLYINTVGKDDWHMELKVTQDKIWTQFYGKREVLDFFKDVMDETIAELAKISKIDESKKLNNYEDTVNQYWQKKVTISYFINANWTEKNDWERQFSWYIKMLDYMIPQGECFYQAYKDEV